MDYLELFGYIGTALVIISMMMSSVTKLRIINICGSIISAIYSYLGSAWPIVVMNICLIIINVYHLIKEFSTKKTYAHVKTNFSEQSVLYFLEYYKNDIFKFFPNFKKENIKNEEIHLVYIQSDIAGILIGTKNNDNFTIYLDYATPKYRDLSVAKFLFPLLKNEGINLLIAEKGSKEQNKYLIKMGFIENNNKLTKTL